jgi:AcrR family transcriptional regulator
MSPDERRRAIVDAVLPLLREHGRAVTTHQIAEAADIAEGTIFRVFDTKEELLDAALARAFAPGPFLDQVAGIDRSLPLRERLVGFVTVLQNRFTDVFTLMHAMGLVAPPEHLDHGEDPGAWRARLHDDLVGLVGDDAARLRLPAGELVRALRLLTFSGSHPHIADRRLMTPEQIVDLVLLGALTDGDPTRKC